MFCQRPAACRGPAAMPESIRPVVSVSHTKKNVRRDGKKAQAKEKAQKITSGNFRTSVFFGTKNPRVFPSGQRHRTDNPEKSYKSLSVTRLTEDIFLCFGTRPDRSRPKESTRFAFPRRPVRRANRNTARISPASTIGGGTTASERCGIRKTPHLSEDREIGKRT